MRYKVYDFLKKGKANAVSSKALAEALGYRSVRDIQKQIERERAAGAVILSDPCGGGYYLSDDPSELKRFTRTLYARAKKYPESGRIRPEGIGCRHRASKHGRMV